MVEIFTKELSKPGSTVTAKAAEAGEASVPAGGVERFDSYAWKTLMQWTFYGLPDVRG